MLSRGHPPARAWEHTFTGWRGRVKRMGKRPTNWQAILDTQANESNG